ncbi:MAG: DUF3467 domain-containing protein [Novosphingobium sp.]
MSDRNNGANNAAPQEPKTSPGGQAFAANHRIRFRTENVKSSYCNMANATSTREEVILNFGVNQTWDQPGAGGELEVDLLHRIILSPYAALRLSEALTALMREHEQRHGKLA